MLSNTHEHTPTNIAFSIFKTTVNLASFYPVKASKYGAQILAFPVQFRTDEKASKFIAQILPFYAFEIL